MSDYVQCSITVVAEDSDINQTIRIRKFIDCWDDHDDALGEAIVESLGDLPRKDEVLAKAIQSVSDDDWLLWEGWPEMRAACDALRTAANDLVSLWDQHDKGLAARVKKMKANKLPPHPSESSLPTPPNA